jgi:hypothetical protein
MPPSGQQRITPPISKTERQQSEITCDTPKVLEP